MSDILKGHEGELINLAFTQYSFLLPFNMRVDRSGEDFAKTILKHIRNPKAKEIADVSRRRIKTIRRAKGKVTGTLHY